MINFVSGSLRTTVMRHAKDLSYYGFFKSPSTGNRPQIAVEHGMMWCMDNDCFTGYNPDKILKELTKWRGVPNCKFAVLPDVVSDHDATLLLARAWLGTYQSLGYPPAFVLQNGVTTDSVPYDSIAAVFIGGDDLFKYSKVVLQIVKEAKRRGVWVHMGRVNGARRMRYAKSIGCDSIDGTGFVRYPPKIAELEVYLKTRQMNLWEAVA